MECGIKTCCAQCQVEKRQLIEGKKQTNQKRIRTLAEMENYKYLKIIVADIIKQIEMKEKIREEYFRRTRKVFRINLTSRNLILEINILLDTRSHSSNWQKKNQINAPNRKVDDAQGFNLERLHKLITYVQKRRRKKTPQHWRKCGCMSTTTRRLHWI